MPTVCLKVQVSPLDKVMSQFDQIMVYRTTTLDASGNPTGFAEITTSSTRIPIVANVASYTYVDTSAPADPSTAWYAVEYRNSSSGSTSGLGVPSQGIVNAALDVLSVEELKTNFLFGIDLTDDAGDPYPDSLFAFYIESAVSQVEAHFDVILKPTVITEETHDFYKRDWDEYVLTQLDYTPVASVQRVRLVLPQEVTVIEFEPSALQVDHNAGTLEVVPGTGQITLGQTGAFLPVIFGGRDYLPRAVRVDYTAGFSDKIVRGRDGRVPAMLREYAGMLAAEGPLGIAGDLLVGAGIASQSIALDGLSQSINTTSSATNSGYGARILQFQKRRKEMKEAIQRAFQPPAMVVV